MVDSSKVGLTDEPATMPIERGKIREFARACMTSNPDYVTNAEPSVPPTFLTTTNFWMSAGTSPLAKLDIDLRRLLHGGQEYVFHGPPPAAGTEKMGVPKSFVKRIVPSRLHDPENPLPASQIV